MQEDQKKILDWLIRFAQEEDLSKITLEQKYLFPIEEKRVIDKYLKNSSSRTRFEISKPRTVNKVMENLKWILEPLPRKKEPEKYWQKVFELQRLIQAALILFLDTDPREMRITFIGDTLWEFKEGQGKKYSLSAYFLPENHEAYLHSKILDLLAGLPTSSLWRCKDCGKIFLNSTFRPKKFCSNKCLWRFNTRKWREANRAKYNEDQAQKMWEKHPPKIRRRVDRTQRTKREEV